MKQKIKKYVTKINDNDFLAQLSHVKGGKSIIEKSGFKTYEEAMNWLVDELEKINPSYEKMSFVKLASILELNPKDKKAQEQLKYNIESLKEKMLFTFVVKESISEQKAIKQVNQLCGKNWTESFKKAKDNTLDALESLEKEKSELRLQKMTSYFTNSMWEGLSEAKLILEIIRKIPGQKIITVNINYNSEKFDIDEKGVVGYSPEHENLFLHQLDIGSQNAGKNSFVIRQFIPNSEEYVMLNNGKKVKKMWHAVYAFCLTEEGLVSVNSESLEHAMTHDQNGNEIESEDMLLYNDFSDFF